MPDEVYVKKIELKNLKKASIKSKWKKHEDCLEIEIYVIDDQSVYMGKCSQEVLRKKKEINVEFDSIKNSITAFETQENISYELDEKKLKFTVVSEESFDSDSSFDAVIFLKVDLEKVESSEMAPILMRANDDMFDILQQCAKLKSDQKQNHEALRVLQELYEQTVNEKVEFDKTVFPKFNALLNTKKRRIAELERKLEKSNLPTKFKLSSDLDQSDKEQSSSDVCKKSPVKKRIYSSDEEQRNLQPSTSKIYRSPARRKPGSKTNSPRTATPRRTPKKLSLSPRNSLFNFHDLEESDSDDLMNVKSKKPESAKGGDEIFSGLAIKLTQKSLDSQEMNPSSVELLVPDEDPKDKIDSSSSEASQKRCERTFDQVQPAQQIDIENHSQEVENCLKSDDEHLTQKYIDDSLGNLMENSQTLSPSVFDSFPKRKVVNSSPARSAKRARVPRTRSKFSMDTVNILLDDSF